jgi:osmotically-inducible protein OsmY
MKNNFYSPWQREKKRYDDDRDQQQYNNVNHTQDSRHRNLDSNRYDSGRQDIHRENFYGSMQEHSNYGGHHQNQQKQQFSQHDNKWRGWDNSDKNSSRNWLDRTSDEVAGWFGDDDAQRRRQLDKIRGPHRGKGPKGYERSDDRIREDVSDRFYDDPYIDASDISIRVEGKEVILEGNVDSKEAKRRAEYLAESIRGVKDVENRLKINRNNQGSRGDSETRNRY